MANATSPSALSLADLNTTVNHEPRIKDVRIGERLGMAQPLNIRQLIEANRAELERYGEIFTRRMKNPGRGRPATEFWLNEPQTLLLCMLSRTFVAAEVRHEVISVYLAYRRGDLPARPAPLPPPLTAREEQIVALLARAWLRPERARIERLEAENAQLIAAIHALATRGMP